MGGAPGARNLPRGPAEKRTSTPHLVCGSNACGGCGVATHAQRACSPPPPPTHKTCVWVGSLQPFRPTNMQTGARSGCILVVGASSSSQLACGPASAMEQVSGWQQERGLVSAVWASIEHLLTAPDKDTAVRHLAASLPPVESLALGELPALAKLHLSSATSMMATIRKLAPAAFGTSSDASISASTDIARLAELPAAEGALVAALIDLQLFHLQRAAALTAHSRQRLAQQRYRRTSSSSSNA